MYGPRECIQACALPRRGHSEIQSGRKLSQFQWQACSWFFSLPWFRRSWIVQEVVLARAPKFICGSNEMSIDAVALFGDLLTGTVFENANAGDWITQGPLLEQFKGNGGVAMAWSLASILTHRQSRFPAEKTRIDMRRRINGQKCIEAYGDRIEFMYQFGFSSLSREQAHKLMDMMWPSLETTCGVDAMPVLRADLDSLLSTFHKSLAGDPRDKVYAFLGLSNQVDDPELIPEYNVPVHSVYTRYARHLIMKDNHRMAPGIFFDAGVRSYGLPLAQGPRVKSEASENLPSWVPDWSATQGQPDGFGLTVVRRRGQQSYLKAAGDTHPQISLNSSDELSVASIYVDRITRIQELGLKLTDKGNPMAVVQRFCKLDELFADSADFYKSWSTPVPIHEIQWRTLIGNLVNSIQARSTYHVPGSDYERSYAEYRKLLDSAHLMRPEEWYAEEWRLSFKQTPMHECLPWQDGFRQMGMIYDVCQTSNGMVGLLPKGAEIRDEIHVILGMHLPFVLRPVESPSGKHRLVGGCYVHGIMQGEVLESGRSFKQGKICLV